MATARPSPMIKTLLITMEHKGSDFDFTKKLTDLREKYPNWKIEAVAQAPPVPVPPRRSTTKPSLIDEFISEQTGYSARNDSDGHTSTESTASSSSSLANLPYAPPNIVRVGLRVQLHCAPYEGRLGVVTHLRGPDNFKVLLDADPIVETPQAVSWWCCREEVTVIPQHSQRSSSFQAVIDIPSLLDENSELRKALKEVCLLCMSQKLPIPPLSIIAKTMNDP